MEQNQQVKNQTEKTKNSKITITNKEQTNLLGVDKVVTATESTINLIFAGESMIIEGKNLHIQKLDVANKLLDFEGDIFSIKFGGKKTSKNFIKKIFS